MDDKAAPLIGAPITTPAATTLTFCPFCKRQKTEPEELRLEGTSTGPAVPLHWGIIPGPMLNPPGCK